MGGGWVLGGDVISLHTWYFDFLSQGLEETGLSVWASIQKPANRCFLKIDRANGSFLIVRKQQGGSPLLRKVAHFSLTRRSFGHHTHLMTRESYR